MAPYPGDGIGQVLFCMGNAEISMQLAGRYYCGGGGRGSNRGGRGSKPHKDTKLLKVCYIGIFSKKFGTRNQETGNRRGRKINQLEKKKNQLSL